MTAADTMMVPTGENALSMAGETTVPVLEEVATVTTRVVEGATRRVRIGVDQRDEVVETLLNRQDVTINRVPIGSIVHEPPSTRQEGDTWIIPIFEEVVVTETRLVLREELHIRIKDEKHLDRQVVALRTETVEIETH